LFCTRERLAGQSFSPGCRKPTRRQAGVSTPAKCQQQNPPRRRPAPPQVLRKITPQGANYQ
jgi:hypothetical protein